MERPVFATESQLSPVTINMGAVVKSALPILTEAYTDDEWLSSRDIKDRFPYPTSNINTVLSRLHGLYVPCQVDEDTSYDYMQLLLRDKRPQITVSDKAKLNRGLDVYQLSEFGYEWSVIALNGLKKARSETNKRRALTGVLRKYD